MLSTVLLDVASSGSNIGVGYGVAALGAGVAALGAGIGIGRSEQAFDIGALRTVQSRQELFARPIAQIACRVEQAAQRKYFGLHVVPCENLR